jgi:putative redox protein
MSTKTIIVEGGTTGFTQKIDAGGHLLVADEPVEAGGQDKGPNPYELLLSALGACTSMTLRMYADRKGWPLKKIIVKLRHEKIHAEDCKDCETKSGMIDRIEREIHLEGNLDEEQLNRLLEISERCPVARTLKSEININSRLV